MITLTTGRMITLTTGWMIPSRTNRCFIINLTSQSAILNVESERNRETFMRNILKLLMLNVDSYCRKVSAKIHFQISTKENRVSYKRHTSKHGSLHIIYIFIYIRNMQNALSTAKCLLSISGERKLIILMILISDEDILTGMNQKIQDWII